MPGSTLTLRGKLTAMTLATIIALVVLFVFLLIDGKQRMMRWSRSFGQPPGWNKLRPVPGFWF